MPRTLSIMEARKQLTSLPETLFNNGQLEVLEITRRGKPVLAVLPWGLYEAVSETLEVMGDTGRGVLPPIFSLAIHHVF